MEPDHSRVPDVRRSYEDDHHHRQRRYPSTTRVRERDSHFQNMHVDELSPKRSRTELPFPPRHHQQQQQQHYTEPIPFEAHAYFASAAATDTPETPMAPYPSQRDRETIPIGFKPMVLLTPSQHRPQGMSAADALTCQNVELFQPPSARDDRNAEELGIRCIHCSRTGLNNSVIYPSSVETMSNSLRMMAKTHFLQCVMLPDRTREEFHNYEMHQRLDVSRSEEEKRRTEANHHRALGKYCIDLCARINVINRAPAQTGIVVGTTISTIKPSPTASPPSTGERVQHNSGGDGMELHDIGDPTRSPWSRSMTGDPQNLMLNPDNIMHVPYSPPRPRGSSAFHFQDSPRSSYAQGKVTRPSSSYDSSGVTSSEGGIPFIQTAENVWECKFCSTLPIGHRAERHAWYSAAPPDRDFMDQHLRYCVGATSGGGTARRSSERMLGNQEQDTNLNSYRSQPSHQRSFQRNPHSESNMNMGSKPNFFGEQAQSFERYNSRSDFPDHFMGSSNPPQHWRRQQLPPLSSNFESSNSWRAPSPYGLQPQHSYNRPNYHHHSSSQHSQMTSGYHPQSGFNDRSRGLGPMTGMPFNPNSQPINPARKEFDAAIRILERAASPTASGDDATTEVLVESGDKYLITDYFYYVMKQLRICHFKEEDRTTRGGKRDNIAIGFGGLECIHCSNTANARKFFWSNVDRLSNSFSEIPGHVLKCKACPISMKDALIELKKCHPQQMTERPRGSQKTFLRRVWRRLHNEKDDDVKKDPQENSPLQIQPAASIVTLGSESPGTGRQNIIRPIAQTIEEAAESLAKQKSSIEYQYRVLLAIDQDKDWGLADLDCLVRRNIELFCATADDAAAANKTKEKGDRVSIGQVGIRCFHCAASAEHDAYCMYPQCLDDLFPAVRAFKSKHLHSCQCFPPDQKAKFESLKESSSSSFGSIVRDYYLRSAEALGLRNNKSGGIKATGISKPIKGGHNQSLK